MRLTLVILLFFVCSITYPQSEHSRLLFDLQFDKIHSLDGAPAIRTEDRLPALYMSCYAYFLEALIAGDDKTWQEYRLHAGKAADEIKATDLKGPEKLHFLALLDLQSAVLAVGHEDGWKAIRNYYAAWKMVHSNLAQNPDYFPNLLTQGVLEIIAGSLPQEYTWLMKRTGIKGTIASGQAKLEKYFAGCKEEDHLEATLILALSYYQFNPDEERAYRLLHLFEKEYPGIRLYNYLHALAAMKAGHNDTAIIILNKMTEGAKGCNFPYACLLLVEAKLNRLDNDADKYLLYFIEQYKGTNYIRMAYHKLSWYYYLNNDLVRYEQMEDRVLTSGRDLTEADRQATTEAADTAIPNPVLLKARLLYDGGYYDKGLSLLAGTGHEVLLTSRDSLEYHYRLGRFYQKTGDSKSASNQYRQVINGGAGQPWYFIANSMLQMGMIAEGKGKYGEARHFYRSCLEAEKSQYRRSINQKAKAGLERVEALKR